MVLPEGPAPAAAPWEQRGPARSWGEVWAVEAPPQMEDQSLGLRLIPPTWHQMHRTMGTNGCLCFTAAKHKESPQKMVLGHGPK